MSKKDVPPDVAPARVEDSELPAYNREGSSSERPLTEHVTTLDGGSKNKPWLLLKLKSKSPSPKNLPLFTEGDTITGTVELDLEKTEHIQGVLLTLKGETLQVGQEPVTFIEEAKQLWSVEMGEARTTGSVSASGSKVKAGSPKLKGNYSWPFSVTLPKDVEASSQAKGLKKRYPLPPTFTERASPAYVDYKLVVTIQRGRFRIDHTLGTSIIYTSTRSAPPLSELRRATYAENGQLAGPDADPDGWKVLSPIKIQGTIFETRAVDVECTIAIGTPLIYALNSPIPLYITLKSTDSQALELFSSSGTIPIQLRRSLAVGEDAVEDNRDERTDNTFPQVHGRAVIWPLQVERNQSEDAASQPISESATKVLEGEIYVAPSVKPSFIFPRITIRYFVDLLTPHATGFIAKAASGEILTSERIDIVTSQAPNTLVHSRAPPGYVQKQEAGYDNAIGMLTAANQRFLHHHHSMG